MRRRLYFIAFGIVCILFLLNCFPAFSKGMTAAQILKDNKKSIVVIANKTKGPKILGYGFILSDQGVVLTTNEVLQDRSFFIKTSNNKKYDVEKIILRDLKRNLAILQLSKANKLDPVELGDSAKLRIGDKLLAVSSLKNSYELDYKYTVVKKLFKETKRQQDIIDMIVSGNVFGIYKGMPVFTNSGKVVGLISDVTDKSDKELVAIAINDLQYHKSKLKEHARSMKGHISRGTYIEEKQEISEKKKVEHKKETVKPPLKKLKTEKKPLKVKQKKKAVSNKTQFTKYRKIESKKNKKVNKKISTKEDSLEKKPEKVKKQKVRRSLFFPWRKKKVKEEKKKVEKVENQKKKSANISLKTAQEKEAQKKKDLNVAKKQEKTVSIKLKSTQTIKKDLKPDKPEKVKKHKTRRSIFFPWRKKKVKEPETIVVKTDKEVKQSENVQIKKTKIYQAPVKKEKKVKTQKIATAIEEPKGITHTVKQDNDFNVDLNGYWFDIETGLNIVLEKKGNLIIMKSLAPALGESKTLQTSGSFKKTGNLYSGNMMSAIKCKKSFFNRSSLKECSISEKVEILYWDNNKIDLAVYTVPEYTCRQCTAPTGKVWRERTWLRKAKK